MNDKALRSNLKELLEGGGAHVGPRKALEGVNARIAAVRPPGAANSIWELLEHIRIAQEDILRYTLDPDWKSPDWPEGYWPEKAEIVEPELWKTSVTAFLSDLEELIALVGNRKIDLTAEIPHGEGRTYLREILLAADHNGYHLGQIVLVRKALGAWPS